MKIKKLDKDGSEILCTLDNYFEYAVRKNKPWTTEEIQSAWKILVDYPGRITNWFRKITSAGGVSFLYSLVRTCPPPYHGKPNWVGIQKKNAADIRMAVDAMETLIVHPEISVFVLVSGDGDYSPLVQRLREVGKWVVGVGTEANASRKLVSVCSEYKYWGTLVAEVEPEVRPAVNAAFDIATAEQLLVRAFEESNAETMTAGGLKSKMLALDAAFDEHNYGCRSFRAFLAMLPKRVQIVEAGGPDITVKLIEEPRKPARTRSRKSSSRSNNSSAAAAKASTATAKAEA